MCVLTPDTAVLEGGAWKPVPPITMTNVMAVEEWLKIADEKGGGVGY